MPSSSRNGFRAWMLVSRVAWAVGIVAASLGPWHAGGLNARGNAAPSPVARTPWLAPSPLDDQSLDEGEVPAPLEAEGISQIHPSLSPSPFENINLTSGNLALIIPLLHLPGNGLIDLDVMLSLNTKHWEWRIGPGVVLEGAPGGPKVISADGTPHTLVGVGTNDPMSPEFWRYQVVTHLLQKPNGVTVQYGRCDATTRACLPLQESDPFGNVISYEYNDGPTGPRLASITQALEGDRHRQVNFTYDPQSSLLQTMTYGTATWTFEWTNSSNLHRVILATHGAWVFDRTLLGFQEDQLTVTTPTGGVIQYQTVGLVSGWSDGQRGGGSHPLFRRYVASRTTMGPQLAPGTWTFQYYTPGEAFVNTARYLQDPDGTNTTYTVDYDSGFALSRTVVPSGQTEPIETESIDWADVEWMYVNIPLVHAKSTMRDGFTYRTEYTYGSREPGIWADYGQPTRITTYGDFARTTAFTYRHDFGPHYIRGKVTSVTVDPDGSAPVVSSCLCDDYGFMTSKTVQGITTTYAPDTRGNLASVSDGVKPPVAYAREWGRTSETNTALYTIKRHFTPTGTVDWVARDNATGAFERRTLLERDDQLERETLRTPPPALPNPGLPTATNYDHEADAVSPSDPDGTGPYVAVSRGTTWTRTYADGYGRTRRTVVNPPTAADLPTVTTTRYDAMGRKSFESLPFTDTEVGTSYTYDALGRVKTKTTPAGKTTFYNYGRSTEGATVTITEPFGLGGTRTTVQTWQASGGPDGGRLVRVHDAKGNDTAYTYSVIDQLTAVQAPGVLDREYHYVPGTSRLAYEIQPGSERTDYTYYANGLVHTKTDALGHVLTYTYDDVNRVQQAVSTADAAYSTTTAYDDPWSDSPLTVANGYVSSSFTYDNASRLTSRADTIHVVPSDSGHVFTTQYVPDNYDLVGQMTYPSGRIVTYGFDEQRHIQSVTDGARTYASNILYHPSGQVTSLTSGNGVPSAFSYDPQTYWPTGVSHGTNGALLALAYSYFDEGNVKAITDSRPAMSIDLTDGYDEVDRLTHAVGPWGALTYHYDAVGNRTDQTAENQTTTYQYDTAQHNRLVTTKIGDVVTEGFWHNDLGQLVVDGRGLYSYTPGGLLETAQMGSGVTVTHRYDVDGMRAVKIQGSVPHYYVHGPGGQLLAEYEQAGGQLAWDIDYVYAGSRLLAAVRPDVSYSVAVTKAGTGSGTVTTDPPGIDCGATCSAEYPAERSVTLTAIPAQGSGFTGWSGSCSGTSATMTLTVTSSAACTATFSSSPTLVVTSSGPGSGSVGFSPAGTSCGTGCATFALGAQVTVFATPAPNSVFAGWTGDADCADGIVTMTTAKGCTAVFTERVGLTIMKAGSGTGTVTSTPSGIDCGATCAGAFTPGAVVTLTATPATGSTFAGWSGDADCADGRVSLTAAASCTATFDAPPVYTLTLVKSGDGSSESYVTSVPSGLSCGSTCSASFSSGTNVQLTVDVADGFEFAAWQGTGCTTGTVTMTGARTCTAVFEAMPTSCDPDGSQQMACEGTGGRWDDETCSCQPLWEDPLLLTLDGSPIHLTTVGNGVLFDVDGDGQLERIAWTRAGTQTGFLVLDLDGDGTITTGAELLGMPAWAPRRAKPLAGDNSFTLLAAYDTPAQGGNGDGVISAADGVFSRLRLWVDANHDGVSQPGELIPMPAAGVASIELAYRTTGRRDGLGNFYRYRGRVHLQSGRTVPIWDVLLRTRSAANQATCSRPQPAPFGPLSESATDGTEPFVVEVPTLGTTANRPEAIDPPPASERVEYYHLDMLGSVRAVTDAQGHVVAHHDFLPFGEEWFGAAGGPGANPVDRKLFTGKERDTELDLDYFGARYYRADLGRFTTIDPKLDEEEALLDPQQWNRCDYAKNNPLKYVDESGESPTLATAAVGAGIGAVAGFLGSAGAQFVANGYSFSGFSWRDAGASALGGAVSGALAGATLGVSLIAEAGAGGAVLVSAGSNVVGGAVTRAVDSQASTKVVDGKAIVLDAVGGAAGGAVGVQASRSVLSPVGHLESTAAGMVPAARAGSFSAGRGVQGIAAKIEALQKQAEIIATVSGAKTTNVVVPVAQAFVKKRDQN